MPQGSRTGAKQHVSTAADRLAAIQNFLAQCREPALLEPGEEIMPIASGNLVLERNGGRLTLQAWDQTRNFTRKVTALSQSGPGRLELTVERFGRREGKLWLLDLARRSRWAC